MNSKKTIVVGSKYVPEYCVNYFDLPCYERDLMRYFDYCDYSDTSKNPTKYFDQKKVVNFNIIHHECRGDPLEGSYNNYQTVKESDLKNYPKNEKEEAIGGLIRYFDRKDLFVENNIVTDYFKK